jgi:hypothetical protein
MSPDFIRNTYACLLESTKEESNDFIGAWGLGSKTPLAVRNEFYLITTVDGIKYEYLVYKNASGLPDITLLTENKTTECNGTVVKLEVLRNEISVFEKNIKEQLCYFDNVYVEGFSEVSNNYSIIESDCFIHRNDYQFSRNPHIVLGKVPYPINYNILGLNESNFNQLAIGLKFNIGELQVLPNRESISYDEESINIIKSRLFEAVHYVIEKFNEKNKNIETFKEYVDLLSGEVTDTLILTIKAKFTHFIHLKFLSEEYKKQIQKREYPPLLEYKDLVSENMFFFLRKYFY